MKAIEYTAYGAADVLRFIELATPTPKDDEVLIRVRAASINALDWRLMSGKPTIARMLAGGLRKPQPTRPGVDVAGEVEAVGSNVTRFKPGDAVFGACRGTFAEFACARENKLAMKPPNVSFEDAAAVPVADAFVEPRQIPPAQVFGAVPSNVPPPEASHCRRTPPFECCCSSRCSPYSRDRSPLPR